jgi:hypothetical protein
MPFLTILTSIPSRKVVVFKKNRLAKRVKERGEEYKKRYKSE